ncbi:MAG: rod shape-determining protein MreC [Candidatus Berkelbacteria bacterium]|nr:rod shape-determining protein MreC [Candidatus Berkelbacteria bacterium]
MIRFPRWNYRVIILVVVVLLLVASQFRFFSPIRDLTRRAVGAPASMFDSLANRLSSSARILFAINDLSKENAALRLQNSTLEAELAKLKSVQGENETLRQDLNFKSSRNDLKLTPAEVLTFSPSGLYQAFTINRGSRDGIKENQAVVSNGFLIGKIHTVADSTSEVWLITNRNLLTPVVLTGSQTIGLLSGGIRGLVVENIPLDTKVTVGESVVTSSLEGIYPSGIAVGNVEEIISSKEEIFLTLRISTPTKFGDLTVVFVVTS